MNFEITCENVIDSSSTLCTIPSVEYIFTFQYIIVSLFIIFILIHIATFWLVIKK
jgi:hypothetical protein